MRSWAMTCAAAVLVVLAGCGGDEDEAATQVAVTNGGNASIDATVGDGETELSFEDVAPGTTSSFQTATFGSLSALTVTVGTQASSIDLSAGRRNVVEIGADGKVEGVVTVAAPASSGGGDGW